MGNKRKFNLDEINSNKKPKGGCWRCGKPGHFKKDCHVKITSGNKANIAGPSGSKDTNAPHGTLTNSTLSLTKPMSFVVDSIGHSGHVNYLQNTKIGSDSDKQNLFCDLNNKQIKSNNFGSNKFNTKVQPTSCDGTNIRSVQVEKIPLRYEINETRSSGLLLDTKSPMVYKHNSVENYVSFISESFYVQDDMLAWWVDSGATSHVCKDLKWFEKFEPIEDGSILRMGNVATEPIKGVGKVRLVFTSGKHLLLDNVLYVPGIRKNLLSGIVLNNCGYKQVIESDKFILS
ncbi:putative RNA-directed DNA polymerase [Helianthus annuus]|nr:putative RNA-directed DNA polymerase [Helianthus annuus]KAJ0516131.1 putative RNA-directed DNA polymerase [Helianthus annuus]KAJ0684158.1 putative RNA-directed DNA polymerase [Helianthus annuus]KAJ0869156.1 putative RNA-directed DNA polymerase [Helianthus annuus]